MISSTGIFISAVVMSFKQESYILNYSPVEREYVYACKML